jgi:tetratricopeptide (TPR) repeat protein
MGVKKGRAGARPDPEFDAFLRKQSRLVDLQTEHLHEQRQVILSRLILGRWKDRVGLTLQLMTAVVGLAIALAVGVMAWQAHEDHGVAIEAFSVPPDFIQRGLTGQVVANRLLDRLADLQASTVTARPASSYANDWGGDIKVEIPDTGVSIGELNRYLRQWLGSETRISGEIVRTAAGVAVTARAGETPGQRFEGSEADVDKLIGQAAEAVYRETQPYRYAVYLASHGQLPEASAAFADLARSGAAEDRPWAYAGWASILQQQGHHYDAIRMARASISLNPMLVPAYETLGVSSDVVGHWPAVLDNPGQELAVVQSGRAIGFAKAQLAERIRFLRAVKAFYFADFQSTATLLGAMGAFNVEGRLEGYAPQHLRARALASLHEVTVAEQLETGPADTNSYQAISARGLTLGDWTGVVQRLQAHRNDPALEGDAQKTVVLPLLAQAYAHLGRLQQAEALVAGTPTDCYQCLTARGDIATLEHDWPTADRWFAELDRQTPSRSLAPAAWAASLLARGDLQGAINQAKDALRRSPCYADPLELWGEALMRMGDFQGAAAKFADASRNAPRWGRNHLLWGEALMLSGRYGEARAQYEAAAGMDLSKPDRAALDLLLARTASGPLHG